MSDGKDFNLQCPLPLDRYPRIVMGHGGGGKLSTELIEKLITPYLKNEKLSEMHDSARIELTGRAAFTTDSYVVSPIFFRGGDIGKLAVYGTVNDLAMSGALPRYLSLALILEEGLEIVKLERILQSIRKAAEKTNIQIITGDTKVVDHGKGDGIFINTSGIGEIKHGLTITPKSIRAGDAIIVSGDLGRHGIAIMAEREGLKFESELESDCEELSTSVRALIEAGIEIRCLRDLTRGGLASALVELSRASYRNMQIDESSVPVCEAVRGACEILGFDPLYVANEGRMVCFVPEEQAGKTIGILKKFPHAAEAGVIGKVLDASESRVFIRSRLGVQRILDTLSGEQLPRIC